MAMQIDAAFNYNDLAGLESLKKGAREDDPEALKVVAQQFESMFISLIMKSMREATDVFASELESSYQTKFYRDMHDQQLSLTLSKNGGFGLAEVLYNQLTGEYSKDPARSLEQLMEGRAAIPDMTDFDLNDLQSFLNERVKESEQRTEIDSLSKTVNTASEPESIVASAVSANNKAPVFSSPSEFIKTLLPVAEKTAEKIGLDPKVLVAQAALETGWGQKVITKPGGESSFNFFGIKADQRWQGDSAKTLTHEYIDGKAIKIQDAFRAYESIEDSFDDYLSFVSDSERYQKAIANAGDPNLYLKALQGAGYATDPNYADKISRIANSDWFAEG